MAKIQDIYYDMTPREIAKLFGKSLQTVTMGVSRMAKEHPEWKIKEGRSVTVSAAGVEWLAETYFRLDKYEMQLLDEQQARMQREIEYLKEQLAEKEKEINRYDENLKLAIQEKNEADKQYRLENDKNKERILLLENSNDALREENKKLAQDNLNLVEKMSKGEDERQILKNTNDFLNNKIQNLKKRNVLQRIFNVDV